MILKHRDITVGEREAIPRKIPSGDEIQADL